MAIPFVDPLLDAVAWPGQGRRGHLLPGVASAIVAVMAGPRAGLWQLATWGAVPLGDRAKRLVKRPRPFPGRLNPRAGMPQDPSFPSTHALEYVVVFGFASWLLRQRNSTAAGPASIASLSAIALVGPSRVRTGDHRWSDVAGGYVLGALLVAGLISAAKRDPGLAPTGVADPGSRGIRPFVPAIGLVNPRTDGSRRRELAMPGDRGSR